jgi:hypothetical protein
MKDFDSTILFCLCVVLLTTTTFFAIAYNQRGQEITLYKKVTSIKVEKIDSNTFAVMYPENNYAIKETYYLDSEGQFHRFVVE